MKIAIIHDWIKDLSGAERVLKALHEMFPEAPIYTLFYDPKFTTQFLPNAKIHASFLQKIPGITKIYSYLTPLMPSAVESFDLSEFDVVISSCNIFAKGVILRPKTKHICYCYSPSRMLWDRAGEYERTGIISSIVRHWLRIWDRQAADRVDQFVAISTTVQDRIRKYYQHDALVINPPVIHYDGALPKISSKDFYLIVSRLYPHKNIAIAIEAFNKLCLPLIIIGDGPERKHLQQLAGSTVRLLGYQNDAIVAAHYAACKAFIMPQEEDFGITPIEAMHYGKPVIALRKGGALEIIQEGITGVFFDDPIPQSLAHAVQIFEQQSFHSTRPLNDFSLERFRNKILNLIEA